MRSVAVLGDVHGNTVALHAVLEELHGEEVDLVVWMGDLSWGWEPTKSLALVRSLDLPARYVRGNAERSLLELRNGTIETPTERDLWMLSQHDGADLAFVESFEPAVSVEIDGLGATLFCHGSPRSDEELLTSDTPEARVTDAAAGIAERVLVTAHTHVQFDRRVAGMRSVNPGSVGMPYEGRPGAYWAMLGPGVQHRRTEYDVDEAVARIRAAGDPAAEQMVETISRPPTREELIGHAERLEFSG